ncbi:hypothetical protein [Pseudohongiella spirulinae]|uniref:Uncharacterized protein n=1 Tax=Pseudohongiella spirulinae TaxID=1249552 RepID=A0A0S2KEL5_9GAMM|nr:hypothetical protein [Pseudohongiella spirulinae]ALO46613.1 hypothetical protein PS2015_1971 [Pseudohongiella spirulinae]
MMAVIEVKHKCVWGIGETIEAAKADAYFVIRGKAEHNRPAESDLSYAHLSPNADLDTDGLTMWQWVIQDSAAVGNSVSGQMGLF